MKFLFLLLFLPVISFADVINFYSACEPAMKSKQYVHLKIMERTKNDCWTRIYCHQSKVYPRIGLYHICKLNGKFDPDQEPAHPETYFDFGNSLFEMTDNQHHGFNSISFQGQKIFLTGYGINEDGELVSRVIQNYTNPKADNRDREVGKKIFESKNGFYEFKENPKKDELYFYEKSRCEKDSIKIPQFKYCFSKKQITY